jgi:hypothetical protein
MSKTMKLSRLKEKYEIIVNEYVQKFCNKQDLEFEFWVAGIIGDIAFFGDAYYFDFKDIVRDINTNQPKGLIIKWLQETIKDSETSVSYFYYSM